MALPDVILDVYEGATIDYDDFGNAKRFVRPATLDGFDVSTEGGDKSAAMFLAMQAVKEACAAHPLPSSQSDLVVRRIFIRATNDTQGAAQIIYERPTTGGTTPSVYIIKSSTTLATYESYTMPDTFEEIQVDYVDKGYENLDHTFVTGDPNNIVPPDNILFSFLRPIRRIGISALRPGQPNQDGEDLVGEVNNAPWPTSGGAIAGANNFEPVPNSKPKGFWLLESWSDSYSKYTGYAQLEASALTQVKCPWIHFGTLRNQRTGRYVTISPVERQQALQLEYSRGIHKYNGFVRVDPHYETSFPSLFDF